MPSRISSSVGSGFSPSSQADCMIIPGVQKPHWRPCWSQNACWSGWRVAPSAIPSIVLISRPSAWTASIVQDLALWPSTWTVQAPQLLVSQPTWVPVSPRSSRRKWTRSRRGSTSASCAAPLTVTETCWVVIVRASYAYAMARSTARRSARRVSSAAIARLYSTGPRTSPNGRLCAAGGGAGSAEERHRDGRVAERGRPRRRSPRTASSATPVTPMPGALDAAVRRPAGRSRRRRRWRSRRPCARASRRRRRTRAAGAANRISVRTSVGSMAVWNVSRKKSRAAIDPLAGLAAADDASRFAAMRTAGQSEAGSAWATEPPIVPQLRTCGSPIVAGRRRTRQRVAVADDLGLVDLAVGRPGTDAQVVVRLDDARRGRPRHAGRRAGPAARGGA